MKTKEFTKKMDLNKKTIVNLRNEKLVNVKGGMSNLSNCQCLNTNLSVCLDPYATVCAC
jgi:hypothetical protein